MSVGRCDKRAPRYFGPKRAGDRGTRQASVAELREQPAEYWRLLLELNNAMMAEVRRGPLLRAIALGLADCLSADRMTLTLIDPPTLRLFELSTDDDEVWPIESQGAAAQVASTIFEPVITSRAPLVIGDLHRTALPGADEPFVSAATRSLLSAPLTSRSTVLGTITLESRQVNWYGDEQVALLSAIAGQAALAVENMLSFERLWRFAAQLEDQSLHGSNPVDAESEWVRERDEGDFIGASPGVKRLLRAVETVAPTNATVLICGETGTGKELIAHRVHEQSDRSERPFITVNCAALPATLIENELFGHEKGAYTGATARNIGRFELADGGTVFLDEVGELPLELQPKLLRILQDGEFERIGGTRPLRTDIRVIAATNRDLRAEVEAGRFRADLFFRLGVFPIAVPALRDRIEDISVLTKVFVARGCARFKKKPMQVPAATLHALQSYSWPGNVRELENIVERAVLVSRGDVVELDETLRAILEESCAQPVRSLRQVERSHILAVLEMTAWRVSGRGGAAAILGLKPTTLEARMKKLDIRRRRQ